MLLQNLNDLKKHLEAHDLEGLKAYATPVKRHQNRSLSFRSALMISAHNLHHLAKIPTLEAECIILNLEDGVSPALKPFALLLSAVTLASYPHTDQKMVVRINPLDEGGIQEIAYLNPFMPDAIRIPKIKTLEEVQRALELIDEGIELHLSIETKEAWLALAQLAVSPRVCAYYLGVLDLFADFGMPQTLFTPDNPTAHYLLSHFLITAQACGVKPVSFVYQEHTNHAVFDRWLALEHQLGFTAKGCITPLQTTAIHHHFGYTQEQRDRAHEIIRLFEEHAAQGMSGFVDERYGFIDEPIYKGAKALLQKECSK